MALIRFTLLFTLILSNAYAESYFILGNKVKNINEEISKEDVKSIFLGEKLYWKDGERIIPVHPPLTKESTTSFLQDVVKMDASQYLSYWRRKLFSGRGYPPKKIQGDEQIIEFVKKNDSAIAVISKRPPMLPVSLGVIIVSSDNNQKVGLVGKELKIRLLKKNSRL
jgi:hypothetical protein